MLRTFTAIAAVAALLIAAPARAQSLLATNGNVIQYSEGPIPGMPSDSYFAYNTSWPVIAEDGSVVFLAQMEGGSVTPQTSFAYFKGTTAADLTMLTRLSDPAPGLPGLVLRNGNSGTGLSPTMAMSPDGRTFWQSMVSGPGVNSNNNSAYFGGSPESPVLIAREGAPAPGTLGAVYTGGLDVNFNNFDDNPQYIAINRNGTVVFRTALAVGDTTTANNTAVFYGPIGSPGILYRTGDTMLPGVVASNLSGMSLQLDNNDRVLFGNVLSGAGVTAANDYALWLYTPGSGRTLLVREGDPAPGTVGATLGNAENSWGPGTNICSFLHGQLLYTADLKGGDAIPGLNDRAVYVGSTNGGPTTMISRSNDPAPGTDGYFFGYSPFFSAINDSGRVLLQAQITGGTVDETNNNGYWTAALPGGPLTLIARTGDPAPGTNGATFAELIAWPDLMNEQGKVVFFTRLAGPDIIPGFDDGALFAWDSVHGLWLLARGGESIPSGNPDVTLTPWGFSFQRYNNSDGSSVGLSKNGILAMRMHLLPQGQSVVTVDLNCYPPSTWYADVDGDGYGDPNARLSVCANATAPAGYVTNSTDCDDTNLYVNPGASDANCNGLDDNCSGAADEGYVSHATSCGTGACARTGTASCDNGVEIDTCAPGAPSAETCNGIDDNCDGAIDNAAAPTGTPALLVSRTAASTAHLTWSSVAAATGYDVVMGDLQSLAVTHGSFSAATTGCLGNDLGATTVDESTALAAGQGIWYALRAVNCGGHASYNSGAGSQVGSRDAGIAASGHGCP